MAVIALKIMLVKISACLMLPKWQGNHVKLSKSDLLKLSKEHTFISFIETSHLKLPVFSINIPELFPEKLTEMLKNILHHNVKDRKKNILHPHLKLMRSILGQGLSAT